MATPLPQEIARQRQRLSELREEAGDIGQTYALRGELMAQLAAGTAQLVKPGIQADHAALDVLQARFAQAVGEGA